MVEFMENFTADLCTVLSDRTLTALIMAYVQNCIRFIIFL